MSASWPHSRWEWSQPLQFWSMRFHMRLETLQYFSRVAFQGKLFKIYKEKSKGTKYLFLQMGGRKGPDVYCQCWNAWGHCSFVLGLSPVIRSKNFMDFTFFSWRIPQYRWMVPRPLNCHNRFIFIALVSVLPELMSETDPKEAMKQLGCILLGIAIMAVLSFLWYPKIAHIMVVVISWTLESCCFVVSTAKFQIFCYQIVNCLTFSTRNPPGKQILFADGDG